ncbi:MAG TPA: tRNA pseudouridine(55) synthase TruB, partial [Jatrophihabitans sp.]|nr:tRNA pseudouridine(55) synthase TruB [Jatrophihabitans sp.]
LSLSELADRADPIMLALPTAIAAAMPVRALSPDEARELSYGRTIPAAGIAGTYGGIGPTGEAVALLTETGDRARPVLGFTPAG